MVNLEEIKRISQQVLSNGSEQNVKYNIVIPFLTAFGHNELELEHSAQGSMIDINIGNKIIVESKASQINLDSCLDQVKSYSSITAAHLAILTNGKIFRFYSPDFRSVFVKKFSDKLIYEFDLKDFTNPEIVERIYKIIGFESLRNHKYLDFISEREKEIIKIYTDISEIENLNSIKVNQLHDEIKSLRENILEIENEIESKEQEIGLYTVESLETKTLKAKFYIPETSNSFTQRPIPPPQNPVRPNPKPTPHSPVFEKIYEIVKPNIGVKASGKYYNHSQFKVLKGSTVSNRLDPGFGNGAANGSFLKRKDLESQRIIYNREFTQDYVFSSISDAACVVLGGSRNGKKEWK